MDALIKAAMILTENGPVDPIRTVNGKIFVTACALYSEIALLTPITILLAPLIHRLLHTFHLAEDEIKPPTEGARCTSSH